MPPRLIFFFIFLYWLWQYTKQSAVIYDGIGREMREKENVWFSADRATVLIPSPAISGGSPPPPPLVPPRPP